MTENISDFKQDFNQPTEQHKAKEEIQKKILEFSGESMNCCVCLVDMIDSTKISSGVPYSKISFFYSTFLNSMADTIEKHGGKIVKSIGDSILFYFPESFENYLNTSLRCGLDLLEQRTKINDSMRKHQLPIINYNVSSDHGRVMIGYSAAFAGDDIFGNVVNMCSKINSIGNPNELIIGCDFHSCLETSDFHFEEIKENPFLEHNNPYRVYNVKKN